MAAGGDKKEAGCILVSIRCRCRGTQEIVVPCVANPGPRTSTARPL